MVYQTKGVNVNQFILLFVFFGLFFSCATSQNKKFSLSQTERVKDYQQFADQIVREVKSGADEGKVAEMGMHLITMARPIINNFQTAYPDCSLLLETILERSSEITELNLEMVERGYHEGELLPEAPEHCHAAKELIVHPATVVVIAKRGYLQDGKQKIADEIEEVVEHATLLY